MTEAVADGDKALIKQIATIIKKGVATAGSMPRLDGPRDGSIGNMDASMIAKEVIAAIRLHDGASGREKV